MILALLYPIVLGLDRLETSSFLRTNGTWDGSIELDDCCNNSPADLHFLPVFDKTSSSSRRI
jgi:hypothetical protein